MLYGKIRKFGNLSKLSPFFMSKISPKKLHINKFSPNVGDKNIARIANTVQCHNYLSGNKDCYETRFSIVSIVISVSNITSHKLKISPKKNCHPKIVIKNSHQNWHQNWHKKLSSKIVIKSCLQKLSSKSLIKCLKGHKSQRSPCSVVKTLIVSLVRPRDNESY